METIETMTTEEAAQELRARGMKISPETIRLGLLDRRFPFGDCIPGGKQPRIFVYRKLLNQWIAERV